MAVIDCAKLVLLLRISRSRKRDFPGRKRVRIHLSEIAFLPGHVGKIEKDQMTWRSWFGGITFKTFDPLFLLSLCRVIKHIVGNQEEAWQSTIPPIRLRPAACDASLPLYRVGAENRNPSGSLSNPSRTSLKGLIKGSCVSSEL